MILTTSLIVSVDHFMHKIDSGLKGSRFCISAKEKRRKNTDSNMLTHYGKTAPEKGTYAIFNDDFRLNYKIDSC